jgi:hypothetical protein
MVKTRLPSRTGARDLSKKRSNMTKKRVLFFRVAPCVLIWSIFILSAHYSLSPLQFRLLHYYWKEPLLYYTVQTDFNLIRPTSSPGLSRFEMRTKNRYGCASL